jgi:hypothetical protein
VKLSSKSDELKFLSSEFNGMKFELFATDKSLFLNCIVCWCKTANEVVSHWKAIQSLISVYFQPSGQIAKWNIYLVILCAEKLPLREKYIVQNDKYAVRKIVLDGLNILPNSEDAELIINRELLGTDLSLQHIEHTALQEIDPTIANLISGAPLDMSAASKEKRASMINNIIETLNRNEN